MIFRYRSSIVSVTLVALALAAAPAWGQRNGFKPPTGSVPHTTDGKPDFSGVWDRPYVPDMTKTTPNQQGLAELPFTAKGLAAWNRYHAEEGDYTGACLPVGLVRSVNSPMPMQIVQNAKYMSFNFEFGNWYHVVPIDGRGHRELNPTWFGDSIGRWDGDTLVIDTINVNGKTRLDTIGHPLSDKLHVIQRYTRTDLGHIAFEMTIDDPVTFTKPWKNTRTFTLRPDWELMEYSCEENNKSLWEGRIKVPTY